MGGGGQNFEFQYYFFVFRKMNIFVGMNKLWLFLRGLHKPGFILGLVVNATSVGNFAFLFYCTPVGQTSDSMTVLT